jgi:hypothetical protein
MSLLRSNILVQSNPVLNVVCGDKTWEGMRFNLAEKYNPIQYLKGDL